MGYQSFTYRQRSDDNKLLQQRLIELGLLDKLNADGEPNDDGIFGGDTAKALGVFLGATEPVTVVTQDTFNKLWPTRAPSEGSFGMDGIIGGIFKGLLGNLLNWQLIQGYLRNVLIAAGGAIGADGIFGHDGTTTIIGALMTIVGVVVSAISNNTKVKAMAVAKAVDVHKDIQIAPSTVGTTDPVLRVSKTA